MSDERVRGFVVDSESGAPSAGTPLQFVAEVVRQETDGPRTERVSIGILQSDPRGYLSAPLRLPDGTTRILGLPLGGSEREPVIEIDLSESRDPSRPLRIPIPPGSPYPGVGGFPDIVEPEAADLATSPGSIGLAEGLLVGEDGCAVLLPSRAPTFSLRFRRILTEPVDELERLDHIPERPPCESFGDEFKELGPLCVRRGALLEYEMTWYPVGHALGEVVYSLPLAPCESVDLAVVDWSRDERIARTERTALTEGLLHELRRDRALQETLEAVIQEWQEGSSFMGGTAGAGGYMDFISGTHAIGGGNFSTSGSRNVAADGIQRLADAVTQVTSRVRDLRTTTVVQATEAESDVVQTRTVTNHNHCHALTVLYFQVVRHFRVRTRLARKSDVIFIKRSPILDYSNHDSVLAHRRALERFLLDPGLARCFDALEHERCARIEFERSLAGAWGVESLEVGDLEARVLTGEEHAARGLLTFWLVTSWGESVALEPLELDETRILPRGTGLTYITGVGDEASEEEILSLRPTRRIRRDVVAGIKVEWSLRRGEGGGDSWRLAELAVRTRETNQGWVLFDGRPDLLFDADHREEVLAPLLPARPPRVEDMLATEEHCCIDRLMLHLQTNSDYYDRVLWLTEDPDTRARLLDRYGFSADGRRGRLLDFVENRLLGTLADFVILPLGTTDTAESLISVDPEPEERAVALPGRGLFAEAKLGTCNSCEKRDPSRYWDWTESPCPHRPPAIAPVSLGSRARDRATPTPTPLGEGLTPETPPAAPDAGAIFEDVMEVLRTSDIFRDMSGREQVAAVLTELIKGAVEVNKAQIQRAAGRDQAEREASDEDGSDAGSTDGGGGGGRRSSGDATSAGSEARGGDAPRRPSPATEMSDRLTVARQTIGEADLPAEERQELERRLAEGAVQEATAAAGAGPEVGFRVNTPTPPGEEVAPRSRLTWAFALATMLGWREGHAMSSADAVRAADAAVAASPGEATFQELFEAPSRPMDDPPTSESRFGRLLAGLGLTRRTLRPLAPDRERLTPREIERLLRDHGPVWMTLTVGPGGSPSGTDLGQGGAASSILVGIRGDGTPEGTVVERISPSQPDTLARQSLQAFYHSLEFAAFEGYNREVYLIYF